MSRIVRGHLSFEDHFTTMPNAWLRDDRLSFKARGLLANLLSHKEGWSVTVESLAAKAKDGKDSVRSGIQELEQAGYLHRAGRVRDEHGMLGDAKWYLQEPPMAGNPPLDNPLAEDPLAENPPTIEDHLSEEHLSEEQAKEPPPLPGLESVPAGTPLVQPDGFEVFWDKWPKKVARIEAVKVWKKLKPAERGEALTGVVRVKAMVDQKMAEMKYLPNPDRWLRGKRWEDLEAKTEPLFREKTAMELLTDDEIEYLGKHAEAEGRPFGRFTEDEARAVLARRGVQVERPTDA